ncbi:MAG: hypothetical protein ACYTEQ_04130 [Planctomycetota bacterium]|jgi:hypothetical protein
METKRLEVSQTIGGLSGLTLGDFWSWAYSDVLNNRNRSILAEFLVASALGLIDETRVALRELGLDESTLETG